MMWIVLGFVSGLAGFIHASIARRRAERRACVELGHAWEFDGQEHLHCVRCGKVVDQVTYAN